MGCRNPSNSITFAPVFSFMLHLMSASEKVVSQQLLLEVSSCIRLAFCGYSESVKKYQLSCSLTFSCGLLRPINSTELGFEIITLIQKQLEKHFSQGICPCKPCCKVSKDLDVLECCSTHTQKYTIQKTDKADDWWNATLNFDHTLVPVLVRAGGSSFILWPCYYSAGLWVF